MGLNSKATMENRMKMLVAVLSQSLCLSVAMAEDPGPSWTPEIYRSEKCPELMGIAIQHKMIEKGIQMRQEKKSGSGSTQHQLSEREEQILKNLLQRKSISEQLMAEALSSVTIQGQISSLSEATGDNGTILNITAILSDGEQTELNSVTQLSGQDSVIRLGIESEHLKPHNLPQTAMSLVGLKIQLPMKIETTGQPGQIVLSGPGSCLPTSTLEALLMGPAPNSDQLPIVSSAITN